MANKKKNLVKIYEGLPKEVKVLPYIVGSAVLAALIDYLKVIQIDNAITMAVVNIVIVVLVELNKRRTK